MGTDRCGEALVDGRLRRSQRSRDAIVTGLLELIGDGNLEPTAQQVAERANVAIRSVFRHFSDMEALYATLDARLLEEVTPMLEQAPPDAPLPERVEALVRLRASLFERIAPYKRSGDLKRWRSPFLANAHRRLVAQLRSDLLRWLPELAEAPVEVVEALDQAASFEAWDRLRRDQGLGPDRARAVVGRAVRALIETRDARGTRALS